MTQDEIVKGNKLIAEFMGYVFWKHSSDSRFPKGFWSKPGCKMAELIFDHDWNELMSVVEKISNIHYPDYYNGRPRDHEQEHEYDDCAYPRTFGMRDAEGNYMVRFNADQLHTAPTFIEAVWLAVTSFIQWYATSLKTRNL